MTGTRARWGVVLCAVVAVAIVVIGVRLFLRSSNHKPAVLTPGMNVHSEFSDALDSRIYRVLHARVLADAGGIDKVIALTFDDGPYPIFTPRHSSSSGAMRSNGRSWRSASNRTATRSAIIRIHIPISTTKRPPK